MSDLMRMNGPLARWSHVAALLALVALILPATVSFAAEEPSPRITNPGFETGPVGESPVGWSVPPRSSGAYRFEVVEGGRPGRALLIEGSPDSPRARAHLEQDLEVMPYRGRSVRFSARVRFQEGGADAASGTAGGPALRLSLHSFLAGGERYQDLLRSEPVSSTDPSTVPSTAPTADVSGEATADGWHRIVLRGRVHPMAEALQARLTLSGAGRALVDDVELEILDPSRVGHRPPAPLSPAGRANLVAFARLLPLVRYFHPSDEAAAADWDTVLLDGVARVEEATGPAELARRLEKVFRPLAPTLAVGPAPQIRRPPPPVTDPVSGPVPGRRVVWRHLGVGGGSRAYLSERLTLPSGTMSEGVPEGVLSQKFRTHSLAGARVRLTASARLAGAGGGAGSEEGTKAELRLVSQPDSAEPRVLASTPIAGGEWARYELTTDVPGDAGWLGVELRVHGDAAAILDEVSLHRMAGDEPAAPAAVIANGGFEDGAPGLGPLGWRVASAHPAHVFEARGVEDAAAGRLAVRLERRPEAEPAALVPPPQEPAVFELGAGVVARLPLSLHLDAAGRTLPRSEARPGAQSGARSGEQPGAAGRPSARPATDYYPAVQDRTTRLAGVVRLWGVLHHFYPYFDLVDPGAEAWARSFEEALTAAAVDDGSGYRRILQRQMAPLADGHAMIVVPWFHEAFPPFTWDLVDGDLILTSVLPAAEAEGLAAGDRVTAVGGVAVAGPLAEARGRASAATEGAATRTALRHLAAGVPGSSLELTIESLDSGPGGQTRTVEVTRSAPPFGPGSPREPRPGPVAELEPGILYVDLVAITDSEFEAAIPPMARAEGLIFDLRGYPEFNIFPLLRHLADRPLSSPPMRTPLVWLPNRRGPINGAPSHTFATWTVLPRPPHFGGRAVFLTDAGAISTGETLLGMIQHFGLGEIIGSTTAGTNGDVNHIFLPGRWRAVFTGLVVTRHDGAPLHGVGIRPSLPVQPTRAGIAAGRDEVLEASLERLRQAPPGG